MPASTIGDARIRIPDRIGRGDTIIVNSIVSHPMDTGFFRTRDGDPIPAYFIAEVTVSYADREILRCEWTSGISRDPVLTFALTADKEGLLTMVWKDNKGATYHQTVTIAFTAA